MGFKPIFILASMRIKRQDKLEALIGGLVSEVGLKWLGMQCFPQGSQWLLRVFVDKEGGITVEDCARLSRRINALLSVEGLWLGGHTLEVSSPGLDRFLFTPDQCGEQIGKVVKVSLKTPLNGRRHFEGTLSGIEDGSLILNGEDGVCTFVFSETEEVRVVPKW